MFTSEGIRLTQRSMQQAWYYSDSHCDKTGAETEDKALYLLVNLANLTHGREVWVITKITRSCIQETEVSFSPQGNWGLPKR